MTTEQDTAASTAADAAYAAGMTALGAHPAMLTALDRCAARHSASAADMGDVSAATLAYAMDALARKVGLEGMPATDDDAAAWIDTVTRWAARRARDEQRAAWSPRIRESAPSDAPNRLERWNSASLIAHAERYTMGALTTREQAEAVLDAHAVYAWPMVTRTARVTRTAANGERVVSSERVGGALCAPRHGGSTSPAAESTYWRARRGALTAGALTAAMGAPMVDALSDAYTAERVRRIGGRGKRVGDLLRTRRVSWARVAAGTGRDRGTVRRETVRAAGRVAALVSAYERREARRMVDTAERAGTR